MEWQKTFRPWYHTFLPGNQGICTAKSLSYQGVRYRHSSVSAARFTKDYLLNCLKKSNTKKRIWGYQQQHYHQLLLGLFAVLRSRRAGSTASQGKFSMAALRGTCFHPPSLRRRKLYWAFTTISHLARSLLFLL